MERRVRRPKILLIEDDRDQRELITEVLCIHFKDPDAGRVVCASTAAEALSQDLDGFDIVLLDYNLPDMPGLTVLERILSRADIPVIVVTGENVADTASKAIARGAQDYIVKLGDYLFSLPVVVEKNIRLHQIKSENERLQQKLELMLQELKIKNLQLAESLKTQQTMAKTDPLTGLANRRCLGDILERYYSDAARYAQNLTCCMCDLDSFKRLNDELGHQVGDKVLTLTAEIIRSSIRSSDVAARYGGDEFVILLPHTPMDRGLAVAERIRHELILRARSYEKLSRSVTMSIGIASLNVDKPPSGEALVCLADRALYVAKQHGRDQIVAYSQISALGDQPCRISAGLETDKAFTSPPPDAGS